MREIKFRAWNKSKKIMVYEDEDNESDYWDGVEGNEVEILNHRLSTSGEYEWLQYTGLKDKNGKEIYEGDYVKYFNYSKTGFEICKIEWADKYITYVAIDSMCNKYFIQKNDEKLLEVIGNIYENPELLEEE